ncbi:hypothetical protein C8046_06545 [Serinibacter arcticus]|uniref:ATP-grasp domain-containing protein n=1 Tax=Serinibacter arcticus TaxID=1655435 RepID=A0A2U1ZTU9_9MICO|nr:ATP-grasp domain-containing protein [Serinibacter arcticus]PWD50363.1 hypothetical protein C8046_06545 [Serinibacter arcticus]
MTTVLVTGAGGPAGRALGAQLAQLRESEPDLIAIGADMLPIADASFALTTTLPRVDAPEYAVALRDLVGRVRADVVIPTVAEELALVAGLADLLGDGVAGPDVVVTSTTSAAICADKLYTMWALDAAGVSVPRFAPGGSCPSAAGALAHFDGAVIAKPRVSRGGRGVRLVEDAAAPWGIDDSWILQSFAPGTEYSPQVYRSPRTGAVTVVVLEKTEMREGRIGNAVSTVRLDADEAADVAWLAESAVVALDLSGPVDLDIRRDEDGLPVVLEVNARFGANSASAPELLRSVLRDLGRAELATS